MAHSNRNFFTLQFAASFSLFVESTYALYISFVYIESYILTFCVFLRAAFWLSLLLMPFGLIPASYLLSLPFSSPARSTVFAYIWSFITFGGAFALNAAGTQTSCGLGVFLGLRYVSFPVMSPQISTPVWYLVYPPWILLRGTLHD